MLVTEDRLSHLEKAEDGNGRGKHREEGHDKRIANAGAWYKVEPLEEGVEGEIGGGAQRHQVRIDEREDLVAVREAASRGTGAESRASEDV